MKLLNGFQCQSPWKLWQALNSLCKQERQALCILKTLTQHERDFFKLAIKIYLKKKYPGIELVCAKFSKIRKFLENSHLYITVVKEKLVYSGVLARYVKYVQSLRRTASLSAYFIQQKNKTNRYLGNRLNFYYQNKDENESAHLSQSLRQV